MPNALGCLVIVAILCLALLVGPFCFAYDLNHLVPLITHRPLGISMFHPAVLIGGFFLSEIAVPVAIVVWVCVAIGVLA